MDKRMRTRPRRTGQNRTGRVPSARRPPRDGRRGGASAPSVLEMLGRLQPALEWPTWQPNA
eukprot:4633926-Pyramimonas_sp.AAC.1